MFLIKVFSKSLNNLLNMCRYATLALYCYRRGVIYSRRFKTADTLSSTHARWNDGEGNEAALDFSAHLKKKLCFERESLQPPVSSSTVLRLRGFNSPHRLDPRPSGVVLAVQSPAEGDPLARYQVLCAASKPRPPSALVLRGRWESARHSKEHWLFPILFGNDEERRPVSRSVL